jgi:iron complex outermembrane receptor protein
MKTWRIIAALIAVFPAPAAIAQDQPKPAATDYGNMSIEDLMNVKVTSASKKSQPLDSAPCAITVITQDDIHRSGAVSLPEALRLAPGVQVQQLTAHYYAITIRGFDNPNIDGSFGNKILVLIDGRTIYSPYASTVYWEVEDLVLEDVDRIEVIRGPGGSLYGANAVNGVINIITKSASQTQGLLAVGSLGSLYKDRLTVQYGWKATPDAAFRVYGKLGTDGNSELPGGASAMDGGSLGEAGFRGDLNNVGHGSLMVQGAFHEFGIYENQTYSSLTPPYSNQSNQKDVITAAHLLSRWDSNEKSGAQTTAQAYFDLLDYPYSIEGSNGTTWDLDVQRRMPFSKGRELIVGGGYRYERNATSTTNDDIVIPQTRRDTIYNMFAHYEMPTDSRGRLTLGAKLEHNTFCGTEFEPDVRYLYRLSDAQTLWAAVSRVVRTPSQSELNGEFLSNADAPARPGALPTAYVTFGSPALGAEVLVAGELGYRVRATRTLSFDFAGYYNSYSSLIYTAQGATYTGDPYGTPAIVVPSYLKSGERGDTFGFELESRWNPGPRTQVTAGYSVIGQSRFSEGSSIDAPTHQVNARLSYDFSRNLKADAMLYWYSAVPDLGAMGYAKLDLQVLWNIARHLELSVAGYNLLNNRYSTFPVYGFEIPRSAVLKLTLHP